MEVISHALMAAKALEINQKLNPIDAWKDAAKHFYPDKTSARTKGCPKSTFLGLCEDGLVKGSITGDYLRSKTNKNYALEAVKILKMNHSINESALWSQISQKQHNNQITVVKALFDNGYILPDYTAS